MSINIDTDLVKRISGITRTTYSNIISEDDAVNILEELVSEVERLEENLSDEIEQRENYYKPISKYEEIGMSERDFY